METVIFACVHNAGRSQMAAAFFNAIAPTDRVRAVSGGTKPAERIHPEVEEVMRECGIDLSTNRPQKLTHDLATTGTLLVTMGCGDQCQFVPGLVTEDWPVADPKGRPIAEVRAIRQEILQRVRTLIESRGWSQKR